MSTKARAFQLACRSRLYRTEYDIARPSATNRLRIATTKSRSYAAQSNPTPSRRAITVTTDDGRYSWSELSTGEKAARTTQQSFNFLLVAAGVVGTCLVSYYLYTDLFSLSSYSVQFNHAVDRIKSSPECRELLGPAKSIVAFGEPTSNKWARARPIAHTTEVDKFGNEHFRMHFNVEGPDGRGVVNVHMTKPKDGGTLEYKLLSLNVTGKEVVYLENKDAANVKAKVGKMFGVQWR